VTTIRAPRVAASKTTPLVLAAGAALLAPTLLRPEAHGPVLCPLRRMTGLWCPTCGMTRAVGWSVHLDFEQAVRFHPLAPVLLVECLVAAFAWAVQRRRHPDGPMWSARSATFGRSVLVANALIFLVVWVIRLHVGAFDDLS
jgi:hypothetical protein